MKCKKKERCDHLVVIGYAGKNLHHQLVKCLCDCGREVNKSDYTIRKPSVYYKACGHTKCEYSRIRNTNQDMGFAEKKKKQNSVPPRERFISIKIDPTLANRILGMAW